MFPISPIDVTEVVIVALCSVGFIRSLVLIWEHLQGNTQSCQTKYGFRISEKDNDHIFVNSRICGVSIFDAGQTVICDCNRNELRVFTKSTFDFCEKLPHEPKGMARIDSKRLAITFPYHKIIRIYEVHNSTIDPVQTINLKSFGKPFSVTYNNRHFAVEIGEGDDGFILIIDENGYKKKALMNVFQFAHFNSNTMRLALNMKKENVYIVSVDKQTVTCIDLNETVIWHKHIACPRGILFVEDSPSKMDILVASKDLNIIFQLNSSNGESNILKLSRQIERPRYLDYSLKEKLICVQVNDAGILVFRCDVTSNS